MGDESFATMTADELSALENRNVATLQRSSDAAEAVADERQDPTTSLNFPLHWTSAKDTWDYLFDFSVAGALLAPRPDDLILDFAAGTCWATELLARLGVRTVSMDLSVEMMRRGRARLDADSRLIFRDSAAFIAARGQSLPFAADTFDGVLCMNALHHLPSYATALREIHRVLKSGGRAVFSEPGTEHSLAPLSQFRMREEQIIEKSVSLPLIRRLAFDAGFSRMTVVPLRSVGGYAFDYVSRGQDDVRLREMWDESLRLYPAEHARFVLQKGDEPAADTFLPANQLAGRLAAGIVLERVSDAVRTNASFDDVLRVTNTGSVKWKARGRRFGGQVTAGLKICDMDGNVLREDLGRTPIPHDVAPGDEIPLVIHVPAALPPGAYQLRYDMVVEGVTWFEFQGSTCPVRLLNVLRS